MHIALSGSKDSGLADEPALVCVDGWIGQSFHYWRGQSGRRYLHTVYPLIGCPSLPRANYVLVRREDDGSCTLLSIGQTCSDAASLNLAHLRHEGAKAGASEVHIHLLAGSDEARHHVERDLARGQQNRVAVTTDVAALRSEAA